MEKLFKTDYMRFFAILLPALMLFCGCAKEEDESAEEIQQRILEAYLQTHYPDATQLESGLVIIDSEPGTGKKPIEYGAAYMRYNTKDLYGNYTATTNREIAEQLGTYSPSVYYGPKLMTLGYGSTLQGLNEAMMMMNKGAKMTVILPPWLTSYDGNYNYTGSLIETQTSSSSVIYELEMGDVVDNIMDFQIDSLESYRDINFPGVDSTVKGYYFKKLEGTVTDTVAAEKTVKINYIGRLLDGYIFDTNIADSAKKYRIYDSEKAYEPLEVTMKSSYTQMTSGESSDSSSDEGFVEGFARAVKSMTYGDKAVTFFWSSMGYGDTNNSVNGEGVPSYSMLKFDLYMLPEGK